MKKRVKQKLVLAKETLRNLAAQDFSQARGRGTSADVMATPCLPTRLAGCTETVCGEVCQNEDSTVPFNC